MAHPQECSPRQRARWRLQRPRMDNMRTAMADDGARSGNRTRIPFRMRDFKSLASTSFAIRANEERYTRCCKRRRTITSPPGSRNPNEWPLRARRQSRFQARAQAVMHSKKNPQALTCGFFNTGGRCRNRTGVHGFAIRCITTLPTGLKTKAPHYYCGAILQTGAGNETRTRDPDLGKVVLYQLSYSRIVLVTGAILYLRDGASSL